MADLGERFSVHHRTTAAHLVRRSVPMRSQGLTEDQVPEAARLYDKGLTLMEVSLHFGVSQGGQQKGLWPRSVLRFARAATAIGLVGDITLSALGPVLGVGRLPKPCPTTYRGTPM